MDDTFDLDAYMQRIGYDGPRTPSHAVLAALIEAHTASIPFENLDILLGRPIRLDLASIEAKLVAARRGGYCFEQNTLFKSVLERLGFHVTALAARVRLGNPGPTPRTHMILRVDLADGPHLADVGFGDAGVTVPIPIEDGAIVRVSDATFKLRAEQGTFVLAGDVGGQAMDLYAFTLEPQFPIDFEVANHFTSTHPNSHFVRMVTAQWARPGRRALLRGNSLVLREGGRVVNETIRDPQHLLHVLREHFGLAFPEGTTFPV